MKLTEHFSLHELGLDGGTEREKENGLYLCNEVLEPVRDYYNVPLIISSGKRNPTNNEKVGGVLKSQHLYLGGNAAADFSIPGQMIQDVFDWLRLKSGLKFDQCILEYKNGIANIVHVSTNRERSPRRVALVGSVAGMLNGDKYKEMTVV